MPVTIRKNPGSNTYKVSTPNQVHAKATTKAKAEAQKRIIDAADHGHKVGKK